jgi:hypothetical protein
MPEIGFDDEPISPVSRDDTVTKRNPKRMIRMAPRMFIFSAGMKVITTIRARIPAATYFIDRS